MADISVTAAQVTPGVGCVQEVLTAGAAITAGQPVYRDSAVAQKAKPCDADASEATAACYGIALCNAALDQPVIVAKSGRVVFGGGELGDGGEVYVVSANAGGIAPVADLTNAWYRTILGVSFSDTILILDIQIGGVNGL